MPIKRLAPMLLVAALLVSSTAAIATGPAIFVVEQPIPSFELHFDVAGVPTGAIGAYISKLPTHLLVLDVEPNADDAWVLYTQASFWSVGNDRLEISWTGPVAGTATVLLVAGRPGTEYANGFEISDPSMDLTMAGDAVTIGPEGAILNERGALIRVDSGAGYFGIVAPCCDSESGNASGAQVHVGVEPPPNQGGINWPAIREAVTVLAGYDEFDNLLTELQIAAFPSYADMRIVAHGAGGLVEGTWFPVAYDTEMKVRFDGYFGTAQSTLVLLVDGQVRDALAGFDSSSTHLDSYRLGMLGGGTVVPFEVRLDAVELGEAGPTAESQLALAEDFAAAVGPERFPQWARMVEAAGSVSANSEHELRIAINNPTSWGAYLEDDTPALADGYSVRFTVDTSLLTMGTGEQLHMLIGYQDEPAVENHLQIRIRPDGNDFEIRADVWDDLDVQRVMSWLDLSRGEHLIEAQWRAATSSEVKDGYVRLFVDGQFFGEVTGLDNDQRVMESVRFGVLGVDDRTSGTITYDDFASFTRGSPGS